MWNIRRKLAWQHANDDEMMMTMVMMMNKIIIINTFVKCRINGPQMCCSVELTWKVLSFCANV